MVKVLPWSHHFFVKPKRLFLSFQPQQSGNFARLSSSFYFFSASCFLFPAFFLRFCCVYSPCYGTYATIVLTIYANFDVIFKQKTKKKKKK